MHMFYPLNIYLYLFDPREQCMLSASNFTDGKTQGRKGFLFFSSWTLVIVLQQLTKVRPPQSATTYGCEQCEFQFREFNGLYM